MKGTLPVRGEVPAWPGVFERDATMIFRRSAAIVAVLLLVGAAGCPDSERTPTGNAVLELLLEFTNNERTADLFTFAVGSVTSLVLVPLDEGPLATLDGAVIGALSEAEAERLGAIGALDFSAESTSTAMHVVSGNFLLDTLQLEGLQFVADNVVGQCADGSACDCDEDPGAPGPGDPCVSAECGSCTVLPCGTLGSWTLASGNGIAIRDLATLRILDGDQQTLKVTIDGAKLGVEYIEALFPNCGSLSISEVEALVDAYPTYLSVELN